MNPPTPSEDGDLVAICLTQRAVARLATRTLTHSVARTGTHPREIAISGDRDLGRSHRDSFGGEDRRRTRRRSESPSTSSAVTGATPSATAAARSVPITARTDRDAASRLRGGATLAEAPLERDGELAAHCGVWVTVHEQEAYR